MKNLGSIKGTLIAFAVAGFFGCNQEAKPADNKADAAPAAETQKDEKPTEQPSADAKPADDATAAAEVKCTGINECKGQGACGMPDGSHACAGKNECKGKGWVKVSEEDCKAKGGTVLAEK